MFAKISVLVPTRLRLAQLRTMIASFIEMTTMPTTAELVFRLDVDDTATIAFLKDAGWPVWIGPRLEGYRSLPLFFEQLRAIAAGDLLMTGNDDMVFRTPDWSSKVLAVANRFPDGVFDLGVATFNQGHFPFSIISAHAAETMGQIHPPDIYWGDVYLRDVFATFRRAVLIPEVQIDHQWMGRTPDPVFLDAKQDEYGAWTPTYRQTHDRAVQQAALRLRELVT